MQEYHDPEHRARILGSSRRSEWLKTEELFEKTGITSGMVCVDLGCGAGAVSLLLSQKVGPEGKVYAVDINNDLLKKIQEKDPPSWLVTVQGDAADTGLDQDIADICFMVLLLHEVPAADVIKEACRLLKPDGKAVVLEWRYEWDSPHPPQNERIAKEKMETLLTGAGFSDARYTEWTESHYVMTAVKK